jgi:predicted MPP superfamily phosphohydrolase
MLEDIERQVTENPALKPDFIAITGDLTFSSSPTEYKQVELILDRLLKITGLSEQKERLFIIPGNHDVRWSLINSIDSTGITENITSTEDFDMALSNRDYLKRMLKKFRYYKSFINQYFAFRPFNVDQYYYVDTELEIAGKRLAILGLNSALMSAFNWHTGLEKKKANDFQNLWLGRKQLYEAIMKSQNENADITIALMHHPTEWLKPNFDRGPIENLLSEKCDFILRGHEHKSQMKIITTPLGECYTIAAGASMLKKDRESESFEYNGYNFTQLNLIKGEGTIFMRKLSRDGYNWTQDNDSYPRLTPPGEYTFKLPASILSNSRSI